MKKNPIAMTKEVQPTMKYQFQPRFGRFQLSQSHMAPWDQHDPHFISRGHSRKAEYR